MKKLTLRLLTLFMFLAGIALWAADVWIAKPYTDWTEKDIQKIMMDSPWSKKVTATFEFGGRGGGGGGGGGQAPAGRASGPEGGAQSLDPGADGAGGGGGGGGRGGRGGGGGGGGAAPAAPGGAPETELTIRWASATTVQEAFAKAKYGAEVGTSPDAKKQLATEETYYVISISNLPLSVQPRNDDAAKALTAETTLTVKGKEPIVAAGVVFPQAAAGQGGRGPRSTSATFAFPKTAAITVDDKEVEFATKFGKTKVQTKFNLKAMVVNGKLGL